MEHLIATERDIFPALLAPLLRDVIRKQIVPLRGRRMRLGGEIAVPFARPVGRRNRLEGIFDLMLGRGVERRETKHGNRESLRTFTAREPSCPEGESSCQGNEA